ncbi:MAG: hypothetical protein AB1631_27855 [Acidobacteriota bacterium]
MKSLQSKFLRLGARVAVREQVNRFRSAAPFTVDVREDGKGEYFDLRINPSVEVEFEVIDLRPDLQHLLLMARNGSQKEKFLCGHDERHWFVAAVPGAGVSTVNTAMLALKPREVRAAESRLKLKTKDRFRRRNAAFIRQGEWFFIPAPDLRVDEKLILRNEPLSRGGGSKPHICENVFRTNGVAVYVCRQFPQGVTEAQYRNLLDTVPGARSFDWRVMRRDALVYARGRVSHSDHKTVHLAVWHRVLMNTENEAPSMRHVVFLD